MNLESVKKAVQDVVKEKNLNCTVEYHAEPPPFHDHRPILANSNWDWNDWLSMQAGKEIEEIPNVNEGLLVTLSELEKSPNKYQLRIWLVANEHCAVLFYIWPDIYAWPECHESYVYDFPEDRVGCAYNEEYLKDYIRHDADIFFLDYLYNYYLQEWLESKNFKSQDGIHGTHVSIEVVAENGDLLPSNQIEISGDSNGCTISFLNQSKVSKSNLLKTRSEIHNWLNGCIA